MTTHGSNYDYLTSDFFVGTPPNNTVFVEPSVYWNNDNGINMDVDTLVGEQFNDNQEGVQEDVQEEVDNESVSSIDTDTRLEREKEDMKQVQENEEENEEEDNEERMIKRINNNLKMLFRRYRKYTNKQFEKYEDCGYCYDNLNMLDQLVSSMYVYLFELRKNGVYKGYIPDYDSEFYQIHAAVHIYLLKNRVI